MKGAAPLKRLFFLTLACLFILKGPSQVANAAVDIPEAYAGRMELYKNMEATLQIPWYYLAGADQYEHSIRLARPDLEPAKGLIGLNIEPSKWRGILNPNLNDVNPLTITFFDGLGVDGNGDGKADIMNDTDRLYAFSKHLRNYGTDEDNIRIALWDYYKRDKAVSIIMGNAEIYKKYGRLDLQEKAFPVPVRTHYTYLNTWGALAAGEAGGSTRALTSLLIIACRFDRPVMESLK